MEKILKEYILEELEKERLYLVEDDIDEIFYTIERLGIELNLENFKTLLYMATNIK